MNVLITGSSGFIGKNLKVRLEKIKKYTVLEFNREHSEKDLYNALHIRQPFKIVVIEKLPQI